MRQRLALFGLLSFALFAATLWAVPAPAAPRDGPPEIIRAPELKKLPAPKVTDLGKCDGLLPCPQRDSLIVLRGKKLSEVSLKEIGKEQLLGEDDTFMDRELVGVVPAGERLYVILNEGAPFKAAGRWPILFECTAKKTTTIVYEHFKLRLNARLDVAILDVSPERGGMLLGLTFSGSPEDLDTRRQSPGFAWVNLRTGEAKALPADCIGILHADAAGRIRTLQTPPPEKFAQPGRVGIDLETGQPVEKLPDVKQTPCGFPAFDPLRGGMIGALTQSRGLGSNEDVVGVHVADKAFPLPFPPRILYPKNVQVASGFTALHARVSDAATGTYDESLWVAPLNGQAKPYRLATGAEQFVLLDAGKCLFVRRPERKPGKEPNPTSSLYDYNRHQLWDMMDVPDALPPLTPEESAASYYRETVRFQLTRSFGSAAESRWVFAQLEHHRNDFRASLALGDANKRLPTRRWIKNLFIDSLGRRFEAEFNYSGELLLHQSGAIVMKPHRNDTKGGSVLLLKFELPKE